MAEIHQRDDSLLNVHLCTVQMSVKVLDLFIPVWRRLSGGWGPSGPRQNSVRQHCLEKVPAGSGVLYNHDMVKFPALLSQHIGKTVAYTSIKAEFMASPSCLLLPLCLSFYRSAFLLLS